LEVHVRGFFSGWGIRIAIIAIFAIGALVFRDRLLGGAGDLKVGDCFDEPAGQTEIDKVQHHPCTESHTSEVVFVGAVPGDATTYPATSVFDAYVTATCVPAFNAYTGKDFDTETALTMGYFYPLEANWAKGDQELLCYAIREDGTPVTGSVKNAP
jgi:hypothetical protein